MNEDRWRTSSDSRRMFEWLARPEGDRKTLLWFAGCGRAIWALLPDEHSRRAVEWLEQRADGRETPDDEVRWLSWQAEAAAFRFDFAEELPESTLETERWIRQVEGMPLTELQSLAGWSSQADLSDGRSILRDAAEFAEWCLGGYSGEEQRWVRRVTDSKARFLNPHLLRDIFGNPFRPVALGPRWRSESVVALARTAYDTRDFTLLPILADALEEAGCDDADILAHCRQPDAVHVRGCWVVDRVLAKG